MLCDDCKKREAIYHSVRIINGTEYNRHLCAECQSKSSMKVLKDFGLSELSGFLANFPAMFSSGGSARERDHAQDSACGSCGMRFSTFLKNGFLGCDQCYHEFQDALATVIQKLHGASLHRGKTPIGAVRAESSLEEEYQRLAAALAAAVESENYEEAAVIRDRMRTIKESQM